MSDRELPFILQSLPFENIRGSIKDIAGPLALNMLKYC